jgi:hypothetical protein
MIFYIITISFLIFLYINYITLTEKIEQNKLNDIITVPITRKSSIYVIKEYLIPYIIILLGNIFLIYKEFWFLYSIIIWIIIIFIYILYFDLWKSYKNKTYDLSVAIYKKIPLNKKLFFFDIIQFFIWVSALLYFKELFTIEILYILILSIWFFIWIGNTDWIYKWINSKIFALYSLLFIFIDINIMFSIGLIFCLFIISILRYTSMKITLWMADFPIFYIFLLSMWWYTIITLIALWLSQILSFYKYYLIQKYNKSIENKISNFIEFYKIKKDTIEVPMYWFFLITFILTLLLIDIIWFKEIIDLFKINIFYIK